MMNVDGNIELKQSLKAVIDKLDSSAEFDPETGSYSSKTVNEESLKSNKFELLSVDEEGNSTYIFDGILATVMTIEEESVCYIYPEFRENFLDYPETVHKEIINEDPIDRPIPPTPIVPDINYVSLTVESGLREGTNKVSVGSVIGKINVNGGSAPFIYKLTSGNDKFIISGYEIKVGSEALTKGSYEITVSVTDKNGKSKTATVTLEVKEADIVIDSVTINYSASTYEELTEGVKAGATLATIEVEGGNEPFTYEISGTDLVEVDESGNIKAKSDLKAGDIKATVTVTDAEGDSGETEFNITVQEVKIYNVSEVVIPRKQNDKTWNKNVSDLQKDDVTVINVEDGIGKITGTSKYVIDYEQPDSVDGNWIALHIDHTKLPNDNVKYITETKELEPDKNDWNFNIRLDNKTDKTFKIKVSDRILYTIDLKEVVLQEKLKDITEIFKVRSDEEMTFNKTIKELQKDIKFVNTGYEIGEVTGTINYITNYENPAYNEGNVISFHIDNTNLPKGEIKFALGEAEADPDMADWNVNLKLKDKEDRSFEIKVDKEVLYTLKLNKLVLLNSPDEVLKVLDQDHGMGNHSVSDLQSNVVVSKDSKITGNSKYVEDLELSGGRKYPAGNYLCLHIDNVKLPEGKITSGINNMTDVDTKDYDILLTVTEESKMKPYKIAVNDEILYEYDLTELELLSNE